MDFWRIGRSASGLNVWIDHSSCPVDIPYIVGVNASNSIFSVFDTGTRRGFHSWEDALTFACSLVGR